MKQYVFDFAYDILAADNNNELMREDIKAERKQSIDGILIDYKNGLISHIEAIGMIANIAK